MVPIVSSSSTAAGPVKPVLAEQQPDRQVTSDHLNETSVSEDLNDSGAYYCIKDPVPMSKRSTSPPMHHTIGNGALKSTALTKSVHVQEEEYTEMQSAGHLHPTTTHPSLPSPESPMGVSNTLKRLSRFNSKQMEHLIEMLKTTFVDQPQNNSLSLAVQEDTPIHNATVQRQTGPGLTHDDPAINSKASDLQNSRERPLQLNLSVSDAKSGHIQTHGNYEESVYSTIADEEFSSRSEDQQKDGGEVSIPTLVVEPSHDHDEDSVQPKQRQKSAGLLSTAANANAIKFKLGKLIIVSVDSGERFFFA